MSGAVGRRKKWEIRYEQTTRWRSIKIEIAKPQPTSSFSRFSLRCLSFSRLLDRSSISRAKIAFRSSRSLFSARRRRRSASSKDFASSRASRSALFLRRFSRSRASHSYRLSYWSRMLASVLQEFTMIHAARTTVQRRYSQSFALPSHKEGSIHLFKECIHIQTTGRSLASCTTYHGTDLSLGLLCAIQQLPGVISFLAINHATFDE